MIDALLGALLWATEVHGPEAGMVGLGLGLILFGVGLRWLGREPRR